MACLPDLFDFSVKCLTGTGWRDVTCVTLLSDAVGAGRQERLDRFDRCG
jgi:hypothetical protein